MDLVSTPEMTEETVTDFDFAFSGGDPLSLTLREGDTVQNTADGILLTLQNPAGTVTILNRNLLWASYRTRVIRRPVIASHMAQSGPSSAPPTPQD